MLCMPLLFKAREDTGFEITDSHTDLNLEQSVPPTFQVLKYYRPTKRVPQRKTPQESDGKKRVWNGWGIRRDHLDGIKTSISNTKCPFTVLVNFTTLKRELRTIKVIKSPLTSTPKRGKNDNPKHNPKSTKANPNDEKGALSIADQFRQMVCTLEY